MKEYFRQFHSNREFYLHAAAKVLNVSALNYSLEEIDKMGYIYEKNYKQPEVFRLTSEEFLDTVITYCCEAWIFYFGGEYFDTVSKSDYAYGFPQIINWGPSDHSWIAIAPHEWLQAIEEGRKATPLSTPYFRNIDCFKRGVYARDI